MVKFPKKYNYKNTKSQNIKTKINQFSKIKGLNIFSTLYPLDQKIHPGCIFSLFFQDLVLNINNLHGIQNNRDIGFGLSSNFYSKLNDDNINIGHLEMQVLNQSKKNIKFFDKLNLSCNIQKDNYVGSEDFNRYVRKVFVDLYRDKKISLQKEIAYRSKNFQTNLFRNSIKIKQLEVTEYNIKYFIDSKGYAITIPTTNIETIFADVAIAVNPQDKRYKKFIGQSVIIPIINKIIPIIGDEQIDSFKGSGACRITPGHDKFGLEIAQKHNLPLDVFAIDIHGNFTNNAGEFKGKKVADFVGNIIKYISDIGNLESKNTVVKERKFDLHTDESLDSIMLKQRSIKYSYALDYLSQYIESNSFSIIPYIQKMDLLDILNQKQIVNISTKSQKGILIPIVYSDDGSIFEINDDIIIERYNKSDSNKSLILTLIISNLILDNHLNPSFSIEQLIDVLFSYDLSGKKTKLHKYLDIYQQEFIDIKQYKQGLSDINNLLSKIEDDYEKIQLLQDLLNKSFAIEIKDNEINLNFSILFGQNNNLKLQNEDGFNKLFMDSVWFLYINKLSYNTKSYNEVEDLGGSLFLGIDQKDFVLNTMLLSLEYAKKTIFSKLIFYPNLVDIKGNKIGNNNSKFLIKDFGDNLDTYGLDVMRLSILLSKKDENKNILFNTYQSQNYSYLLNKIWNASRYVYSKYISNKPNIKIKDLIENIKQDVTDYDLWMIHNIKTVLDDYEYQLGEHRYLELGEKIFDFCKNILCDKYLESTKIYSNQNTPNVIILLFVLTLRLIKPYIPFFVLEIEGIFNVDREDYNIYDFRNFELIDKNYKINLLMDIIDKLQNLKHNVGLKKHDLIDVFIQANTEFLDFLANNEEILKSLINISNLYCIRLHENIPVGYQSDNVLNINLGIKGTDHINIKKDVLLDLLSERSDKLEQLQNLKSLIASVFGRGNEELINQKKLEIIKLQSEIESLEFDISKIKSKQ